MVLELLLRFGRCGRRMRTSSPVARSVARPHDDVPEVAAAAAPPSPPAAPREDPAAEPDRTAAPPVLSGDAGPAPAPGLPIAAEDVAALGELLREPALVESLAASGSVTGPEMRGLRQLAEQSVQLGIDYASLGLGFYKGHPETRLDYRRGRHRSITCAASRRRAESSRQALLKVVRELQGAAGGAAGAAIAAAFAEEISAIAAARKAASGPAVLAALEGELLMPLRALNEDRLCDSSMTLTFQKVSLPSDKILACVDEITARILDGTYSRWRYENPVGARQLEGLTEAQRAKWMEPTRTAGEHGLVAHEDAEGELGFFWATKIGGPSHGFDFEGQCILPLLANARHKVVLVSDPRWPHYPGGRAHFRLLWTAEEKSTRPVLWLEALNVDFGLSGVDHGAYQMLILTHALRKAEAMSALLSIAPGAAQALVTLGAEPRRISEGRQQLVLRPSNGVVEASDYLSPRHDWLQLEEEVVCQPRTVYEPASAAL